MPDNAESAHLSVGERIRLMLWLPGYIFWLSCYWEVVGILPAEWNAIFSTEFYLALGVAGLLGILGAVFIACGSDYIKPVIIAWYIVAQALGLAVFVARGVGVGVPEITDIPWGVMDGALWLLTLFLPLYTYLWVKRSEHYWV